MSDLEQEFQQAAKEVNEAVTSLREKLANVRKIVNSINKKSIDQYDFKNAVEVDGLNYIMDDIHDIYDDNGWSTSSIGC